MGGKSAMVVGDRRPWKWRRGSVVFHHLHLSNLTTGVTVTGTAGETMVKMLRLLSGRYVLMTLLTLLVTSLRGVAATYYIDIPIDTPAGAAVTAVVATLTVIAILNYFYNRLKPHAGGPAGPYMLSLIVIDYRSIKTKTAARSCRTRKRAVHVPFARCRCDAARMARRYCARCNSTAAAAAAEDGVAITQGKLIRA